MMRRFGSAVLASAVVMLLTVPVHAQQQPQRRGFGGGMGMGGPMLLTNKSVQEELKLDSDQVEKATKIAREQGEKVRDELQGLQDLSPEQRREKLETVQQSVRRATFQALREGNALKDEQLRRFMQIDLQQRGVNGLSSPFVAQRLNLSDEQKAKIKTIVDEQPAKMREIMQSASGDFAAAREKMVALRKEALDKAKDVLNSEQKDQYKEMLGSPFEVKFERPSR